MFLYELTNKIRRKINMRYYLKNGLTIGKNSWIDFDGEDVKIVHPERVTIGDNVHINSGVYMNAGGGTISIGDDVTISEGCKIIAASYDSDEFRKGNRVHSSDMDIAIGDHIWLCAGVIILPGVVLEGSGTIVGAGAVVNRSFYGQNKLICGVPAREK